MNDHKGTVIIMLLGAVSVSALALSGLPGSGRSVISVLGGTSTGRVEASPPEVAPVRQSDDYDTALQLTEVALEQDREWQEVFSTYVALLNAVVGERTLDAQTHASRQFEELKEFHQALLGDGPNGASVASLTSNDAD